MRTYQVSVSESVAGVATREFCLSCFQVSAFSSGEVSLSVRIAYSGWRILDSTSVLENSLFRVSNPLHRPDNLG